MPIARNHLLTLLPPGARVKADGSLLVPCRFRVFDRSQSALLAALVRRELRNAKNPTIKPKAQGFPGMSPIPSPMLKANMALPGPQGTGLSDCAALYAKALSNPFGAFDTLPCVPMSPPTPTQRWQTTQRGGMITGIGGNGYCFLSIAPFIAAKDTEKYFWSGNTFVGNGPAASGTGIVPTTNPALPYTAAQLAAGITGRLVSLGVRVRNISPSLNVGGLLTVLQLDDQQNVNNFTFAQLNTLVDAALVPQALSDQGEWTMLAWRPFAMSSLDWTPDDGVGANSNPTIVLFCQSPALAQQQTFEYEIVEFWEFQGQTPTVVPPNLVLSDADQVGFDRCLDAGQRIPRNPTPIEWQQQMAYGLVEAVAHSDSVARTVEDLVGGGKRGGMLGGALGGILKAALGFLAL